MIRMNGRRYTVMINYVDRLYTNVMTDKDRLEDVNSCINCVVATPDLCGYPRLANLSWAAGYGF